MTMSELRAIASLIKLNFACFGKSLGRPVYLADRQAATSVYIHICMYICVYVCVLPARALYIDQLQHRRVECWSISVAYALRKMLFLNDSPKLSWLWPGPDQQPVPHTNTHTCIQTSAQMYIDRHAYGQLQLCNRASDLTCLSATHLVSNVHKTPTICRLV